MARSTDGREHRFVERLVPQQRDQSSTSRSAASSGDSAAGAGHRRSMAVPLVSSLPAGVVFVGPFQLDREPAEGASFPRADVAYLAVGVVVPAATGYRVSDCLTQLVGTLRPVSGLSQSTVWTEHYHASLRRPLQGVRRVWSRPRRAGRRRGDLLVADLSPIEAVVGQRIVAQKRDIDCLSDTCDRGGEHVVGWPAPAVSRTTCPPHCTSWMSTMFSNAGWPSESSLLSDECDHPGHRPLSAADGRTGCDAGGYRACPADLCSTLSCSCLGGLVTWDMGLTACSRCGRCHPPCHTGDIRVKSVAWKGT